MAATTISRKRAAIRKARQKLRAGDGGEMCSLESFPGSKLTVNDLVSRESPGDLGGYFQTARRWRRDNWFVGAVLSMKSDFVGFNQVLTARERKQRPALERWLDESGGARYTQRMIVERYIQTAVEEFLLQDNLVSFWRTDEFPYPLESERCKYSDALGKEVMRVKLGFNAQQLLESGFTPAEARRYSEGWLKLDEAHGENFRVLTRGMVGNGLCVPRLSQVFRTCSQAESMEVGESLYAYVGRTVVRMHHLGWEVKTANAGIRQTDAMWDAARARGIERFFKGMPGGVAETTGNFDHKISLIWTDPKNFDAKKWETVVSRLQWWGGALAFMLVSRNLNPNFMPVFKAEIKKLRATLQPHLEYVINEALRPPGGLKIVWTDECFSDMRLLWDMIKTLVQQGPASLTTAQRFAGLDPEAEAEQKMAEADDPQADKKYMPHFDPNHGNQPKENNGGRTAGTRNGEGRGGAPATKPK